jgi:drug/metabolite transporter (DMT)-like permease
MVENDPVTIRAPWLKVLFVVAAVAVAWILPSIAFKSLPDYLIQPANAAIAIFLFALGVRAFRGREEPSERPFWRATAGWRWGAVVAVLCVIFAISGVLASLPLHPIHIILPIIGWGGIAAFYGQSTVRLMRAQRRTPGELSAGGS